MKFVQCTILRLYIISSYNADATVTYPIRHAKVKIIPNSYYIPAYYKHFIYNISNTGSLSKCMYMCQNHDYCRTAVYTSQTLVCSLYEEYSFVGQVVVSTLGDQSVISFSFCLSDDINEPMDICFGTPLRSSMPIQNLIQQFHLTGPSYIIPATAVVSTWSTQYLTLAPIWGFDTQILYDVNNNYAESIRYQFVPGTDIVAMDNDDCTYYVTYIYHQVY
jgi:hypothetical protein